ncbi:MAG: hypothetical protein K2K21_11805 [Lachnospiraceae bacterium]|nr:hypothetical protein [Lachnospiraceae bacterium]
MNNLFMKGIIKINRSFPAILTLLFFACLVCSCVISMTSHANGKDFKIDAEMLPSSRNTYNVRLTIENTGEDWEGTVRLLVVGTDSSNIDCAYDIAIALPKGSTKQFTVSVPKESVLYISEDVWVTLLDKNLEADAFKVFKKLFKNEKNLTLGVMSDDYSSIANLDIDGFELRFYSADYLVKMEEIDKDSLADTLNTLDYLIIDTYDTGTLSDDEINDIEQWTYDGGVLIVGTGSYAEDTLRGFDYLGIECREIYSPGENMQSYKSNFIDWQKIGMADLINLGSQYYYSDIYGSLAITKSEGDGAVEILPYSLSELGQLDASDYIYYDKNFFVYMILYGVGEEADRLNGFYSDKFDTSYTIHRLLRVIGDGSNDMSFGVLKFIVIVYVIIIGPILYMILRSKKKRDLYWAAVPAAALAGVLLVFFAGRGFVVAGTQVYSVSVYNLSDKSDCRTYLHCYDAGHEEWSLSLTEGYEYIGPKLCDGYSVSEYNKYYYHVTKDGDRLFFGIKPNSGFEDGYFCAGRTADVLETAGSIDISLLTGKLDNISGTVTNNTDYDFEYFAVLEDESVQVYKGIPAGGTSSLSEDEILFFTESITTIYDFSYIHEADKYAKTEDTDTIAALGIGISVAYEQTPPGEIAIIGVVTDWDKAVDNDCSEVSYACFYMFQ